MTYLYIYFSKATKNLMCFAHSELPMNPDITLCKKIALEDLGLTDGEFNLARFRWDGDYDTGKLVDLVSEKKAVVTQREIDEKYYNIFFRKFRLEEVLFTILTKDEDSWERRELKNFLLEILARKNKEISKYKSSANHIYETEEDEEKRLSEAFKV